MIGKLERVALREVWKHEALDFRWLQDNLDVLNKGLRRSEEQAEEAVDELESVADTSFSLEKDLEASLLSNLQQLEPGLHLYRGGELSGQQLDTGRVGRLDLLCRDKSGQFVVVEPKAGRADDRVCGQILRYMGWVKENLAQDREVIGIIVANDFSDSLKYAARAMKGVTLKQYQIHFTFADVPL